MSLQKPSPSVAILGTRGYPSYYGGFETAVRRLAPYLADSGWNVAVYGRRGETRDDDPGLDKRIQRVVTRGANSKSLSTLSYGFWSAIDVWRRKPDVALIMNVANGFWLPLLKIRGVPTVVNVDGIEWDRAKWGALAKWVFKAGARMTAWFADEIIVDAVAIGERWHSDFGRRGTYIPYGGDDPADEPVEPGLEPGSYVLVVARFVPENSIGEFFDAAPAIAENHDVILVGSSGFGGELEQRAAQLALDHERIQWLGHVYDDRRLNALWMHAGAYFHGHSVGGTNPALVQAMACGAPVVARDTVYNREVLGADGVFVKPEAGAITDAILRILQSPAARREMSANARKRASEAFATRFVNERYDSILNEVKR